MTHMSASPELQSSHRTTLRNLIYRFLTASGTPTFSGRVNIDRMVDWKDPAHLLKDYGASCSPCQPILSLTTTSYFGQAQPCHGRALHVRLSSHLGKRVLMSVELATTQLGNRAHGRLRIGRLAKKTAVQMDNMGELFPSHGTSPAQ